MPLQQVFFVSPTIATGGTEFVHNGYRVHIFTSSGTFQLLSASPTSTAQIFVCGGGFNGTAGDTADTGTSDGADSDTGGDGGRKTLTKKSDIGSCIN